MNAHIHLTQNFSETEYFILELSLDRQFYIICKHDGDRIHRSEFVDPDTVQACVEACQWLIAFFPEYTEQVEHIVADFFTLAHSCTGNVLFAVVLRELGKQEEVEA